MTSESRSDFQTVFTTLDLTQGQVLRARLRSEGIPATLGDEHTMQTQQLWAPALGGVRLRVPGEHVEDAKRIIAEYHAGALALPDEDSPAEPVAVRSTDARIWNPGIAALLSLPFTGVFGAILHAMNWGRLNEPRRARNGWLWVAWIIGSSFGAGGIAHLALNSARAGESWSRLMLFANLVAWYFMAGRAQSKYVLKEFGGKYERAEWWIPVWLAVVILGGGLMLAGRP